MMSGRNLRGKNDQRKNIGTRKMFHLWKGNNKKSAIPQKEATILLRMSGYESRWKMRPVKVFPNPGSEEEF